MEKRIIENKVIIKGQIIEDLKFNHQVFSENFYTTKIRVERHSGTADIIPVLINENLLKGITLTKESFVCITGELRTFNKHTENKSKLCLNVLVRELTLLDNKEYLNFISFKGYVCKKPIYRKTPFNKDITDLIVAVNRKNVLKCDYFPCVVWNKLSQYAKDFEIGDYLIVKGRIQSREYKKEINGKNEIRTAYEVSIDELTK